MNRAAFAAAPLALAAGCGIENQFGEGLPEWPNSIAPPVSNVDHTDEIMQVTTPMVDILWTIDNSCSMADEQQDLTTNFPSFMDYFLGSGLDYHVGVTSTDIDGNYNGSKGKLRTISGIKYLEEDTPNPIGIFTEMASMGTSGSGNEKGMGGTFQALEINRDTSNAGFYRDESAIHTIIISDEPDMTPASVITQDEFVDWYDSLKDETDMRTFSAIISFTVGTVYKNTAIDIGGIVWDIESGDWPQLLERLGVQAAGLKREYFLSQLPVPGTIEVSIRDVGGAELGFDEAVIDPITGLATSGDWTYDSTRNSITFLEYIPNSLSTVVIHYTLLAAQQDQTDLAE